MLSDCWCSYTISHFFNHLILICCTRTAHGKDRRIHYEDGDSEDLSIVELETLASLDPKFDMAVAGEGGLEPAAVQVTALADQQVAGADSTISALDDDDSSKPRTSKRLRKRKRKRKVSE